MSRSPQSATREIEGPADLPVPTGPGRGRPVRPCGKRPVSRETVTIQRSKSKLIVTFKG